MYVHRGTKTSVVCVRVFKSRAAQTLLSVPQPPCLPSAPFPRRARRL